VDLKSFDDKQYRKLGGRLQPILDTIRALHARGLWVEIVTLLIPGFNDSETELTAMTEFLASVSLDIPWHVTAFHQDYRMVDPMDTTPGQLKAAAAIGKRAGLRYVYAGNLPGHVGTLEDTHCASCSALLVERYGYHIRSYHVTKDGTCPACHAAVPGRWDHAFGGQVTARPFLPHDRTRLRIF
jgi:pyruvate formate lyase activating enzyme